MSSISGADLERQLKAVTKTGKYVVGRREVLGSLKGSKLVVWSASANVPPQILNECRTLQVPAIRFDGNPIELGRTCGIPYKVSVIAVKLPGDAVLTSFENSKDYSEQRSGIIQTSLAARKEEPEEEQQQHKESKSSRKKNKEREEVEQEEKTGKKSAKEKTTKKAKRETKKKVEEGEEEGEEKKGSKTAKKTTKKKTTKKKKEDEDLEEAEQIAEAEEDTEEEDED